MEQVVPNVSGKNPAGAYIQHNTREIDLSTLGATLGTVYEKDYFVQHVHDVAFQRMLISTREELVQTEPLTVQLIQVYRKQVVPLSNAFRFATLPSDPTEIPANRAWVGGTVYLRVNGAAQEATINVTIENLSSGVPLSRRLP